MDLKLLDSIFPFFVFFYGLVVLFVLENPYLRRIGSQAIGSYYEQLSSHRILAWVSFFVGGLWSVQNLLFS